MKRDDLMQWLTELQTNMPSQFADSTGLNAAGIAWVASATSALNAALPAGHAVLGQVSAPYDVHKFHHQPLATMRRFEGLVATTKDLVEKDRIESFQDSIRIQTESEILDTAFQLLEENENYRAAAAVLGGGALEVHLRRLYEKTPGLAALRGDPSITKYDGAMAVARKAGSPTPYDATDSKSVIAWAGHRNTAAHTPDQFTATKDQVKLMLDGVRDFIARVR